MSTQLFIQIIVLCFLITLCVTWLIFALAKYTDFGKGKRQENKKKGKIHNSQDDVPISESLIGKDTDLNPFSTPTIETSFGEERIGTVYKHEHKP
tara:strand:- start:8984 stop:9268 length:285 start_codon:yes stop_codon:yes gene_type:complete